MYMCIQFSRVGTLTGVTVHTCIHSEISIIIKDLWGPQGMSLIYVIMEVSRRLIVQILIRFHCIIVYGTCIIHLLHVHVHVECFY